MSFPTCKIAHHGIMQRDPVWDRLEFMEWVCRICGRRLYGLNALEPRYADPIEEPKTAGTNSRWDSSSPVVKLRCGCMSNQKHVHGRGKR
jgi:hypothetical protein